MAATKLSFVQWRVLERFNARRPWCGVDARQATIQALHARGLLDAFIERESEHGAIVYRISRAGRAALRELYSP